MVVVVMLILAGLGGMTVFANRYCEKRVAGLYGLLAANNTQLPSAAVVADAGVGTRLT